MSDILKCYNHGTYKPQNTLKTINQNTKKDNNPINHLKCKA